MQRAALGQEPFTRALHPANMPECTNALRVRTNLMIGNTEMIEWLSSTNSSQTLLCRCVFVRIN